MQIPIYAELQDQGIVFESVGDDQVRVLCPFHEDKKPSGTVYTNDGTYHCFACKKSTSFVGYLSGHTKQPPSVIRAYIDKKYGASSDKTIGMDLVENYHSHLLSSVNDALRNELTKRKVGDKSIRLYRLGADNGRITIPIRNDNGHCVNIKRYRPGAANNKYTHTKGHGTPVRLFPLDQLRYEKIVLCGGEVKAIAAAEVLNEHGIGAISSTGSETQWSPRLSEHFRDKTVYLCYDVDEAGRQGAINVATHVYNFAARVYILHLPLDLDKHPHGDVNDYLAENGDLFTLILEADKRDPWKPAVSLLDGKEDMPAESVSFDTLTDPANVTKKIKAKCVVTAITEKPYSIPKTVVVNCQRSEEICSVCSIFANQPAEEYTLNSEDAALMDLFEVTKKQQQEALKPALGIPERCRSCTFTPTTFYNIEDIRLSAQLGISDKATQRETVAAYGVDTKLVANETYEVEGRVYPHPTTQASTLLVHNVSAAKDALSLYEHGNEKELEIFQPTTWTMDGLSAQLNKLYTDLESNVTHIYQRRTMHLAVDLAYHSPLYFRLRPEEGLTKGWVEILILGDTSQGKSETTQKLMQHYQLGEKVDCKNATSAGLLGGLCQMGKKWYVSWGIIPAHDRRLVVLEELKGLAPEVLARLTDMRSSGIAEIPKIEKRRTHARTRLIALSNPRSDRPLSTYSQGVHAIKELLGSMEDTRRFDMAVIASARDVSAQTIGELQLRTVNVEHTFTSELCKQLILWGWTTDKVLFEDPKYLIHQGIKLCEDYDDSIPLVDSGSMRYKLARLAAALAVRTYSHKEHKAVYVRNCHVDFICRTLDRTYASRSFGYKDFSAAQKEMDTVVDVVEAKRIIQNTTYPEIVVKRMLFKRNCDAQDFTDWTGLDRELTQGLISALCRCNAIKRSGKFYYTTPGMIELLQEMDDNEEYTNRPEYFSDEEF